MTALEIVAVFTARFPNATLIKEEFPAGVERCINRMKRGEVKNPAPCSREKLWRLLNGDFDFEAREKRIALYRSRVQNGQGAIFHSRKRKRKR
jgi:hypothetical protein